MADEFATPEPQGAEKHHGTAGASAFREHERRLAKDAAKVEAHKHRVRQRFGGGRLGGLIAAVAVDSSAKTSTQVWHQGAVGEAEVGRWLDRLRSDEVTVLR